LKQLPDKRTWNRKNICKRTETRIMDKINLWKSLRASMIMESKGGCGIEQPAGKAGKAARRIHLAQARKTKMNCFM
jgi:hypothetical protein